ncbi:uncharacterized protein LOC113762714 [Coffea eugenioides]|uniref:Uncharacterized protein n=1 Tax=Coffea arabica TaxID=13443 RepID=A0A6P6WB81_COFAR|nr:uncharacterized protein LOC113731300 [Coffea arabica]XP_027162082.1 uncharacterized protein LOC113762714 [Coffea eugenioides]
MFEHVTANEIAGYGVGALLLFATISAPKIDSLIAASQRSSLGMCKRCGDLRLIACSRCKGSGSITRGGPFSLNPVDSAYQSFRVKSKELSISCTKCQAKGHFGCPACSRVPQA